MTVSPRAIALQGIGSPPRTIATQGFLADAVVVGGLAPARGRPVPAFPDRPAQAFAARPEVDPDMRRFAPMPARMAGFDEQDRQGQAPEARRPSRTGQQRRPAARPKAFRRPTPWH
jgi:hypothetical protein